MLISALEKIELDATCASLPFLKCALYYFIIIFSARYFVQISYSETSTYAL